VAAYALRAGTKSLSNSRSNFMDGEAPFGISDGRLCILAPTCFGIPTSSEILECRNVTLVKYVSSS
jgi:hypothetical protein